MMIDVNDFFVCQVFKSTLLIVRTIECDLSWKKVNRTRKSQKLIPNCKFVQSVKVHI